MKYWQANVGVWGSLIWFGSFPIGDFLQKNSHHDLALTAFGYSLGFITVFAGHLFWGRIIQGRWDELMGESGPVKIISAFTLLIIFSFGAIGVFNGIFNSNPWFYSLPFVISGIVVNQGVMPIIDHFDMQPK